jgi:MOSC domain-containing protein YiiM
MADARIDSVQTGPVTPLGPQNIPSGFAKTARHGPVRIGPLGLEGDAQADLEVHGGPEKAVYAYAAAHYPAWAARFPAIAFAGGSMGENLTVGGMTEKDICVGDIQRVGTALLQACQPRQPCFKFNLRHGDERLSGAMIRSFQSGWYYRVLEPGAVQAGDAIILEERPNPDFPFTKLVEIVYRKQGSAGDLARMSTLAGLASQWRQRARELRKN